MIAPSQSRNLLGHAESSARTCWALLIVVWIAAALLLIWLHRGLTLEVDEYAFTQTAGVGSLEEMLAPQNGHLNILPFLVFRLLYSSFGMTLLPFVVLEGVVLAITSAGIYVYSRTRIGPLLALVPAGLPLFLGTAWPMLLAPLIALLWLFAIASGVWALILVERGSRAADLGACGLLCIGVASFSLSLVFLVACALMILLSSRRWRRLYVVAIPLGAWVAWYLWAKKFGGVVTHPSLLVWLPAYAVDSIAANGMALLGRTLTRSPATSLYLEGFAFGRLAFALALAAIEVVVCLVIVSRIGIERLNRRSLWIILVIPLAWWASQVVVLEEFRTPSANRYFFAGVVILLLVGVEVARGVRVTPRLACLVFGGAAICLASNLLTFRDGRHILVGFSQEAKANMAMIDLEGRKGDQAYVPSSEPLTPQSRFMFLKVGSYLDVVERYGSPADTLGEVAAAPEPIREAADIFSARLLQLHLSRVRNRPAHACKRVASGGAGGVAVRLPRDGANLISRAPRVLHVGRFAAGYPVRVGRLRGSSGWRLAVPTDRSRLPWRVLASGAAPLLVCPL